MLLHELSQSVLSKFKLKHPVLVAGLCLSGSVVASPAPVDDVKAMFVGHSLINYTMPDMVKQLAESGQGLTMDKSVQVLNGSPLRYNWEMCREADFAGEWPPQEFACDAIEAAAATAPFDTLVVTDANNPISGHHIYNQTQVYLEQFTELLKTTNETARSFLYTSWEGLDYHQGEWLDAIDAELAEYEQIAIEAEQLSAERGRNAQIEVIPANLALKMLIIKIENGELPGLSSRSDIFTDDVHMNDLGNYFIANVVFAAIYNRSPEGLTNLMLDPWGNTQIEVDTVLAGQLQQVAWTVIRDYKGLQEQPGGDTDAGGDTGTDDSGTDNDVPADQTAAPNEKSAIGINMTGLSYWSTQWATIDIMKHASNGSGKLWATGNSQTGVFHTGHNDRLDLDENGWPRSLPAENDPDFHFVTTILYQDNQHYAPGEYTILYEGEGELQYYGVTRIPEKSSAGKDVVRLDEDSFFHLRIRATDPNNSGNYLRNIRVLVPGGICGNDPLSYAQSAEQCTGAQDFAEFERVYSHLSFHPLFLQDMVKYRSIRFMQAMSTNVSEQSTWADRPTYEYASWGLNAGIPIELAVELANQVQADPWLNVPARVDDDYMRRYAQLVKVNLDSNLSVHVELGNEVWNNAWPYIQDAVWFREQGKARWPDAGVHDFIYRLNYYGKRTSDMCEIFKAEFGEQADRVNCVVASQGGNWWVGEQTLKCDLWAAENGGQNCAANIDSLAIGPYFGGYFHQDKYLPFFAQWASEGDVGMDKLFAELNSGILRGLTYDPDGHEWEQAPEGGALASTLRHIQDNKALADRFGLKLTAYEGGQHLTYAGNLTGDRALVNEQMFLKSNRDERMGQAFTEHFNGWQAAGGTLYMVFESTQRWGSYGAFPLKEYQTQPMSETPKLAHTLAYIDGNPCWWENCERTTVAKTTVQVDDAISEPADPQPADMVLTTQARPAQWGVSLSWTPYSGQGSVQYYQVFRDGEFVGHTTSDVTNFNNDWLQLHTEYNFQIKALGSGDVVLGESNISTTLAGDSVAPTQVSGLVADWNGAYGFNLSWNASSDEGGIRHYIIHRNGQPFSSVDGQTTTFSDDWPPQGPVTYQVFAMDNVDNLSEGSTVVTAVLPSQGFTVAAQTRPESWGVALSWQFQHPDIQWFQIFRDGVFIGHTAADVMSFNNDWLELHTHYDYQIRAVDAEDNIISTSNIITTMAGDSQAPSQPTGVTVTYDGAYGFEVTWDASTDNTGIAHYLIKRNGELFTHRSGLLLDDDWPPQGDVSYQIIAVDHYHNQSEPSVVVIGNINNQ